LAVRDNYPPNRLLGNKNQVEPVQQEAIDARVVAVEPKLDITAASVELSLKSLPDVSAPETPLKTWVAQPPLAPTSRPRCKDPALTAAMIQFVQALRAQDVEGLVALFPKKKPLRVASAIAR
jgi:hypothetical protein